MELWLLDVNITEHGTTAKEVTDLLDTMVAGRFELRRKTRSKSRRGWISDTIIEIAFESGEAAALARMAIPAQWGSAVRIAPDQVWHWRGHQPFTWEPVGAATVELMKFKLPPNEWEKIKPLAQAMADRIAELEASR